MRAEELLEGLEARRPYVLLCPNRRAPERSVYPVSPTQVLQRYHFFGRHYLNDDVAAMPDDRAVFLKPWGWCEVKVPTLVLGTPAEEALLKGGRTLARAICKADEYLQPVPLGRRWMLVHHLIPEIHPMLTSCAFWMFSRQRAFVEILDQLAREKSGEALTEAIASRVGVTLQ